MGYIFGSGTRFAAPMLGLAVFAMIASMTTSVALATSAPPGVNVTVSVAKLRNTKGQLMVCLTKNPKAFPDCSKDTAALKKLVSASAGTVTFGNVAPGTYAVAIVHDENNNDKMDLRVFIPREGFGFSRNPKIGMGPPKFKSASFAVGDSDISQSVTMKYML